MSPDGARPRQSYSRRIGGANGEDWNRNFVGLARKIRVISVDRLTFVQWSDQTPRPQFGN